MPLPENLRQFLSTVHPYDSLTEDELNVTANACAVINVAPNTPIFSIGETIDQIYIIASGEVKITDDANVQISLLGPRNSFGERALLRNSAANRTATSIDTATLIVMPSATLFELIEKKAPIARFFDRRRPARQDANDLTTLTIDELMTKAPVTCTPSTTIHAAAQMMQRSKISSICVVDDEKLTGIVTVRDMNDRVVAANLDSAQPINKIMTADPLTLEPTALGSDVLHTMMERNVGHVPIATDGKLIGIVTQTNLTRAQAMSSADLVKRIAKSESVEQIAKVTAQIPQLLKQLVSNGNRHEVVTRLITDIADTVTRRLLKSAEEQLGAPPVPYLWLACGSQGRQEQTGVSDQDNCLILSDDVTEEGMLYFKKLAKIVCDGLDASGYFYCPGDMMATNPRWCQPVSVWKNYFEDWIAKPNPEAQMLASVMFDLRAIGGDKTLFENLRQTTAKAAAENSIFTAHMISNSLKHQPPLGLLRGIATIRSGEHRNQIDLKHNGVVPIVDLGRVYSLQGQLKPVNTRARLEAAMTVGLLSATGGADLLDAYDLIADLRLEHQAKQIRSGNKPDNFLDPTGLSDLERSHLRDAFVVIKTMQSSVGSGKGMLG